MLGFIKRIRTSRREPTESGAFSASLAVTRRCYAVGDIHGRADLLSKLLLEIQHDAENAEASKEIVFLGDYVDRGENSAGVLSCLQDLTQDMGASITCLMGNHEKMLLDFLDRPAERGRQWLRNGGLQTLASFNVGGLTEISGKESLTVAAEKLRSALGSNLELWLRTLPLTYANGNLVCVHAAADPGAAIDMQKQSTLQWGHPDFFERPRNDGLWVAHGHTIIKEPTVKNGRISIDTGAYYSGRLTAAVLAPGEPVRFIRTN